MTDEFYFVMNDPEVLPILAAHFPPRDNVTREQQWNWALAAWKRARPEDTQEQAETGLDTLLHQEHIEHGLLTLYWRVMLQEALAIVECVKSIELLLSPDTFVPEDAAAIWQFISLSVSHVANISRMFDAHIDGKRTTPEQVMLRKRRKPLLRSATGVSATYLNRLRKTRNVMEHFEEYLDVYFDSIVEVGGELNDQICATYSHVSSSKDSHLRWFDPETRTIHILDHSVTLEELRRILMSFGMLHGTIFGRGRYHPSWRFLLLG